MPSQVCPRDSSASSDVAAALRPRAEEATALSRRGRRARFGRTELLAAICLASVFGSGCGCMPRLPVPDGSMSYVAPAFVGVGETVVLTAQGRCYPVQVGQYARQNPGAPEIRKAVGPDLKAIQFERAGTLEVDRPVTFTFVATLAGTYHVEFECLGALRAPVGDMPSQEADFGHSDDKTLDLVATTDAPPQVTAGPATEAWRPGVPLRYDGAAVVGRPPTALQWTLAGCDGLSLTDDTSLRPTLTAAGATTCPHVDLALQATSSTGKVGKDTTRLTFKAGLVAPTAAVTLEGETFGAYQFVNGALDLSSPSRLSRYTVTLVSPDGAERLILAGPGTGAAAVEVVHEPLRFQVGADGNAQLRTEVVTAHGTLVDLKPLAVEARAPGFVVSPMSGPTARDGRSATFTVRLARAPAGPVVVTVASGAPELGTTDVAQLLFRPEDWSTDQTVTVTGVLSELSRLTDTTYAILLGVDPRSTDTSGYAEADPPDVTVTHLGSDRELLVVSAPSGDTTEAGGTATFSVKLSTRPSAPVTLTVASKDPSEGVAAPGQLRFTEANWQVPQLVTVTGVDDAMVDQPQPYAVEVAVVAGAGAGYQGVPAVLVPLLNRDDDTPGYQVSAASGPTTEAGGQATFTVRLANQPNGSVVLGIVSSTPAEGTASPATLTFDAATWATPQTVTVTGVDDLVDDRDQAYTVVLTVSPASTDTSGFTAVDPPDVRLTNLDDDTRAYLVSAASGPTTEAGGQATFTVRLATQPTGTVVVRALSSNAAEGTPAPATLTFTATTWATAQAITVTGVDDPVDDGDRAYAILLTGDASSTDISGYPSLSPGSVSFTNLDDDTAALVLTAASGPTSEAGGQATFTARLATQPTGSVVLDVASADATEGIAAPARLTFTAASWSVPQVVTVTGADDQAIDGSQAYAVRLTVSASSTDATGYEALAPATVALTNLDNDTPLYEISAASGPTTEAGGQATFTMRLGAQPNGLLIIDVASALPSEGTASPATLTFDAASWATPQVVTITGVDDAVDDGDQPYAVLLSIAPASTDTSGFTATDPPDVLLANLDDDTAALLVSAASGPTSEAGAQSTFTVRLGSQPTGSVLLDVSSTDAGEGLPSPATLTFTPATWATPQVVTVTGVDDGLVDGPQPYDVGVAVSAASTDRSGYPSLAPAAVALVNLDNDAAGYLVSAASGPTTEAGGQTTFTVQLGGQPNGTLMIDVVSALPAEGTASPATLTFDAANWATPQVVTVTGADDFVVDGDQPYLVVLSVDPVSTDTTGLTAIDPPDVDLVNQDDDTAGYQVSAASGPTTEAGGTATFTVRLTSQPTGSVILALASSNTLEGTASPASLTFTAATWSTPQTVTVTGIDDALDDGDQAYSVQLSFDTASTDASGYAALGFRTVLLTNLDDDTAGYVVGPISDNTRETGSSATFTVKLGSAPVGTLLVDVASSDTSEGTVSPAQLSFTAGNWSTPQTVTITGVDDALPDGNLAFTILLSRAAASTASGAYATLDPADVSLLNIDDDGAGGEGRIGLFVQDYFRTVAIDGAVAQVRGTPFQATSATLFFQGYAEIAKVPVGPQTVDVTYPGYGTVTLTGTVTAGGLANFGVASLVDPLPAGDLRVSIADTPFSILTVHAFAPNGDHLSNSSSGTSTSVVMEGSSGRTTFRISGAAQLPGDYVFKTWTNGYPACGEPLTFNVYDSTGLKQTLSVPATGCSADSYGWNALRVNGSTVTPIDTFTNVEPTNGNF